MSRLWRTVGLSGAAIGIAIFGTRQWNSWSARSDSGPMHASDAQPMESIAKSTPSPELSTGSSGADAKETPPAVQAVSEKVVQEAPAQVLLHIPAISQQPEMFNGCEVTSLAMLLEAAGHPADKLKLADRVDKDVTPRAENENGEIVSWGDPNVGFVGDIFGDDLGYGVYHGPIAKLLDEVMPGQAVDLTGEAFVRVEETLASGRPVIVWTNDHFSAESEWITWLSKSGEIKATWREHAVLLVGYDDEHLYINDPLDGTAEKKLDKSSFLESWVELGSQAVTYRMPL